MVIRDYTCITYTFICIALERVYYFLAEESGAKMFFFFFFFFFFLIIIIMIIIAVACVLSLLFNFKFSSIYNGKSENWPLLLSQCRYLDKSFTEMFLVQISNKHIILVQTSQFDWLSCQAKG